MTLDCVHENGAHHGSVVKNYMFVFSLTYRTGEMHIGLFFLLVMVMVVWPLSDVIAKSLFFNGSVISNEHKNKKKIGRDKVVVIKIKEDHQVN